MNKRYLQSRDSWHNARESLVARSGNYFEKLNSCPSDNRSTMIECIPPERRAFASQDDVEDFNLNEAGWPMSPISALLYAQTDEQVLKILNRCQTMKSSGSIPVDVSNEQAIRDYIVPRYVGSSSELLVYMERMYQTTITSDMVQQVDKIDVQPSEPALAAE